MNRSLNIIPGILVLLLLLLLNCASLLAKSNKKTDQLLSNYKTSTKPVEKLEALEQLLANYELTFSEESIKSVQGILEQVKKDGSTDLEMPTLYYLSRCYYKQRVLDSSILYNEQLLALSEKVRNPFYQVRALTALAMVDALDQNFKSADSLLHQAISVKGGAAAKAYTWNEIGRSKHRAGDFNAAVDSYFKGLDLVDTLKDLRTKSVLFTNIARSYGQLNVPVKQKEYYYKALGIKRRRGDLRGQVSTLANLSTTFIQEKKYDKALEIMEEALSIAEKVKDYESVSSLYLQQAGIRTEELAFDEAFDLTKKGLRIAEEHNLGAPWKAHANYNLSNLLFAQKKYDESLAYAKESLSLLKIAEIEYQQIYALNMISMIYKDMGEIDSAFYYLESKMLLQDSLNQKANIAEIKRLEGEYETLEKEKEISLLSKDKEVLSARNRGFMYLLGGSAAVAMLLLYFLNNSRKQNQLISQKNKELDYLNQAKDRIFTILGHDLRKPALSFRGVAKKVNYLLQKEEHDQVLKLGEEIEQEAISLVNTIDNLLQWSISQKEIVGYEPVNIPLKAACAQEIELLSKFIKEKSIQIDNQVGVTDLIYADPGALSTIIRNLLDNAIKFSKRGGRITLSSKYENQYTIILSITDEGQGITKDKIDSIFLLSKHKSTKGTEGESGSGLGLYLVKELTELNKGSIHIQSQIGTGTAIALSFPSGNIS